MSKRLHSIQINGFNVGVNNCSMQHMSLSYCFKCINLMGLICQISCLDPIHNISMHLLLMWIQTRCSCDVYIVQGPIFFHGCFDSLGDFDVYLVQPLPYSMSTIGASTHLLGHRHTLPQPFWRHYGFSIWLRFVIGTIQCPYNLLIILCCILGECASLYTGLLSHSLYFPSISATSIPPAQTLSTIDYPSPLSLYPLIVNMVMT